MITSFSSSLAEDIFNGINSKQSRKLPGDLHPKAKRKLDMLNATTKIETLRVPPSNKLKKLEGKLSDYWRIKIDKQWAVIFIWNNGEASQVDIIDYH